MAARRTAEKPNHLVVGTPDKLSSVDADDVLRRAIELHSEDFPSLSLAEVQRIATDLAVPPAAVRTALRERWVRSIGVGPAHRVLHRLVPHQDAATVRKQIHAFLDDQLFEVTRDRGEHLTFAGAPRFKNSVRRALDWDQRYKISPGATLNVLVKDVDDGTDVTIVADFTSMRREAAWLSGLAGGLLVGAGVLVGLLLHVAAIPVGVALGATPVFAGRSILQAEINKTTQALAYLIDRVEHPRRAST